MERLTLDEAVCAALAAQYWPAGMADIIILPERADDLYILENGEIERSDDYLPSPALAVVQLQTISRLAYSTARYRIAESVSIDVTQYDLLMERCPRALSVALQNYINERWSNRYAIIGALADARRGRNRRYDDNGI